MKTTLISVDPGLNECGVAVFQKGVLTECFLGQSTEKDKTKDINDRIMSMVEVLRSLIVPFKPGTVVVERMEPRGNKTSAWSSLIDLAMIGGSVAGYSPAVVYLRPSLWTGKRSKGPNHLRIRRKLVPKETEALEDGLENCPAANHKEILDAVGIGLYHLRRL
jgi:hypothetical protein